MKQSKEQPSPVQRIWTPPLGTKFSPVSHQFLENYHRLGLSNTEAMFVLQLMSFKWDERDPYPALGTVASRMGMGLRSARKIAKKLEDANLIMRFKRSKGSTNRYHLTGLFNALSALNTPENTGAPQGNPPPKEGWAA